MRNICFAMMVTLTGCSSVYEVSLRELAGFDKSNYPLLYSVEWVRSRNVGSEASEKEVAEKDLGTCVIDLKRENANALPESIVVATVQIIECMRRKNWHPESQETIILR